MKVSKRYMRAVAGLYGKESPQIEMEVGKKKKVNACLTEDVEQIKVIKALRAAGVPVHHSPNGGYRNPGERAKFARMGTSAGFPDLYIPKMRSFNGKLCGGLYVELKREYGGKLSEAQVWWRDLLLKEGYAWFLARGAKECLDIIFNYLREESQ